MASADNCSPVTSSMICLSFLSLNIGVICSIIAGKVPIYYIKVYSNREGFFKYSGSSADLLGKVDFTKKTIRTAASCLDKGYIEYSKVLSMPKAN